MGRLPSGGSLPVRNLPSQIHFPNKEIEVPAHYLEWVNSRMARHLAVLAKAEEDRSRIVEEYAGESTETATGETELTVVPNYQGAERITSILVTGPATTAFTLQLGGRYLTLSTDATGKCLLAPVSFFMSMTDQRTLTSVTSGSWFLQLSGYALRLR